jgi:hypothetical protein
MSPEQKQFLTLNRYPAILSVEQCGFLLGLLPHEVFILVWLGLLKPLGSSTRRNHKRVFARVLIEQLAEDPKWLARAQSGLVAHWRTKNSRRSLNQQDQRPEPELLGRAKQSFLATRKSTSNGALADMPESH